MISKEGLIDYLMSEYPQIKDAHNYESIQDAWDNEEFDATIEEMLDWKYAAENLVRQVESAAQQLTKALNRAIDNYDRHAIH